VRRDLLGALGHHVLAGLTSSNIFLLFLRKLHHLHPAGIRCCDSLDATTYLVLH
jgi:hypothetical protein